MGKWIEIGCSKLVLLLDALGNNGIEAELSLIGSGDGYPFIEPIGIKTRLNLQKPIPQSDVGNLLQEHQIGFLPMPNLPVWTISSPLKRSEYMSSGLLVLGINHSGHHLPRMNGNLGSYKLFDQQTFVDDAVEQIQKWMKDDNYAKLSTKHDSMQRHIWLECNDSITGRPAGEFGRVNRSEALID